jgi:hypothetical protein
MHTEQGRLRERARNPMHQRREVDDGETEKILRAPLTRDPQVCVCGGGAGGGGSVQLFNADAV